MSSVLLIQNPAPRKGSAKAKAMMAAVRAGKSPKSYLKVVKPGSTTTHHKKRRSTARAVAVKTKRKYRTSTPKSLRLNMSSITSMATHSAIAGAGAVGVDVLYGYAKQYLPTAAQTPIDVVSGSLNPMYFLAKAAVALGVGIVGSKFSKHARTAAEGALTVSSYELIKSFVPATVTLGQFVRRPNAPVRAIAPNNVRRLPNGRMNGLGEFAIPAAQREAMQSYR